MAKVESYTPPVVKMYRIDLTEEEAKGLFTLLADGVDSRAVEELKLTELTSKLRTAGGLTVNRSICFGYMAELD
jgi:hypothetical protein